MQRKYLYALVTDYPYGIGEPFFEDELFILSELFEKIYVIIPQIQLADTSRTRFRLPANAQLIPLQVAAKTIHKFRALAELMSEERRMEMQQFQEVYKTPFSPKLQRQFAGFRATGLSFANAFQTLLKQHGHPAKAVSLYSYWFTFATAGMAMIRKKNPDYHAVTRIHGWDCFYDRNPDGYLPMRPFVFKYLNRVAVISKMGIQHTLGKVPQASSKLELRYLGIGDLAKPDAPKKSEGYLHIVSIAFVDPVKRLDRIVDALPLLSNVKVKWTHIGNGPGGDDSFARSVKNQLQALNHIEVDFKGELSKTEVFQFLREQRPDALVCTSRSEGLPVSMMEAFGHGIPVISVNVGGISEIVKDDENGMLLPADASSSDLAEALMSFANLSEEIRISWADNAYATYNAYFSAPKNYRKFGTEALQG